MKEMDSETKFSLVTVLAYYKGFVVNAKEMFDSLIVEPIIDPPTTKKGKEIDIKNIVVPATRIISAKNGNRIKGIDPKPSGEYNFHVRLPSGKTKVYKDVYDNINVYHKKGTIVEMEKLAIKTKKNSFPHQITLNYAWKEGQNVNMFIFHKSIKISGFKNEKYAIEMVKKMWDLYFLLAKPSLTFFPEIKMTSIIFESSMTNSTILTDYSNFSLSKINTLFHKLRAINPTFILDSDFETTSDNGVKVTLRAIKPKDYTFNEIVREDDDWRDSKCVAIVDRNKSADLDKRTTVTIYTEKFVVSTRYGVTTPTIKKFIKDVMEDNKGRLQIAKVDKIKKYKMRVW